MKRALLIQLPVPGYLWPVLDANLPLAAGYLAAWAAGPGCASGWQVEILPWQEADVLGDEALLRAIVGRSPDLVGFSLYLWNSERSLALARRLADAGVPVVLGGPEVLPENVWLWQAPSGAARLSGEGEAAFASLLREGGAAARAGEPFPALLDLRTLPSPYLSGVLSAYPDGSIWLETVRGCPFGCEYCQYGKGFGAVLHFPDGLLSAHLAWARERDVREVYLMDPSFNVRAGWRDTLARLERGNPDGQLRLHTELVADRLGPGDGRRLARAGLRSCEVGLQSIHERVLAEVGRRWDPKRWVRGVRELTDEGVKVTVGLIAGLPGDDLQGFRASLDFVLRETPAADLQIFPLALLPGARLRERAGELGLVAQERPPYTVLETPGFSREELSLCASLFEEATGLELDPFGPPALGGSDGAGPLSETEGYVSGVRLDALRAPKRWAGCVAERAAQNLTLWLDGWRDDLSEEAGRLGRWLPHGVLTIVLEDRPGWPPERARTLLSCAGGDHYLDRSLSPLYGAGARLVPRLVAVLPDSGTVDPAWLLELDGVADFVWTVRATKGWADRARRKVVDGEVVLVRGEPDEGELRQLAATLGEDAARLLFAHPPAQAAWEALGGGEAFRAEHRWARLP